MSDPGMAWTTGVVAFVAAVPLWPFTMHVITIAHEGGHAMFGSLAGLFLKKITLNADGSGTTHFDKLPMESGLFEALAAGLAGYLGPSIFGLAGAWLLVHEVSPRSVLLMTLVLLALLLVMVRTLFGFVAVPLTGAAIWAVAMHANPAAQLVFAHVWVWFLLMGGTRQIPELYFWWERGEEGDTGILAAKTGLSSAFFLALFWLGSVSALIYGGVLLLRHQT